MLDVAVIGAGPCGLAVGVAAKRARLTCSLFDKGPVASSLMRYPLYMTFFSTPDKLEIGVPFVTAGDKPTRREALTYYRKVAEHFELDVRQYHHVSGVTRARDGFELVAQHPGSPQPETIGSRHLVFATGYFESPNPLRVPGEDLPHVSHFFVEPHPYWQQRVVVVGGGNSAVEAALELCRVGARVTLVHFLSEFDRGVKPYPARHHQPRERGPGRRAVVQPRGRDPAGRSHRASRSGRSAGNDSCGFRPGPDRLYSGPVAAALGRGGGG